MLGVPKSDWKLLFDWTNRTIGAGDPEYQEQGKTPDETARAAMIETFTYFAKLVEEKKKNPADDLHVFTQARGQPALPPMTCSRVPIIVIAGNETTRNGTTGGMLAFIEHPDQMRKLVRNPRLIDSAVEEIVRWTSPIIHFGRTARGLELRVDDQAATCRPLLPRTATRRSSRSLRSASTATRTITWASAWASTSAWARTWRGSRWPSPTATSCPGSRRSSWLGRSCGCTRAWWAA
jgi:hypothetical protein